MPVEHHAATTAPANRLVVLLPGLGDGPEAYLEHGFVDRILAIAPRTDVVCADAHYGYYREFTVVDRLHHDVIGPARERYDEIWLVGISMGGLGAAAYALEHPGAITGLVLLAPFMGSADVIEEIRKAGGLRAWNPPDWRAMPEGSRAKYDQLWEWYRGFADTGEPRPTLYLGYGTEDRLRHANELVAAVLPEECVEIAPGAHRWTVWQPLFAALSARAWASDAADPAVASPRTQR